VLDLYIWCGARADRPRGDYSGWLIVTARCGAPVLSPENRSSLQQLFSNDENGRKCRQNFRNQVLLTALAAVVHTKYCHFDIRPPNIMAQQSGKDVRFSLIDWEEVVGNANLRMKWGQCDIEDDYWYPSLYKVAGGSLQKSIVFTACQLFLCLFAMRCTAAGASDVERAMRTKKDIWRGEFSMEKEVPVGMIGREKFIKTTESCFKFMQSLLNGKEEEVDHKTVLNQLETYLNSELTR
jgi:hypothetical protein